MSTLCIVGSTFTFSVSVEDQGNAGLFKAGPTIAAGDFTRSINGAAFANLDNLPTVTPAAGRRIQIVLSAAETTSAAAGGIITVIGVDAAGDEWYDVCAEVRVSARDVDDLAYPNTSGRGMDVDASGGVEVGALQADVITASAIAADAIGAGEIADGAITAAKIAADAITAAKFDESTAFPLKSADSGATEVARTGADGDTLETLSDEIAVVDTNVDAILADTGTDGVVVGSHTTAAKAEIQAEAEDALEAFDLDHLIEVTAGAEEPTDGSYLDQVMHKDGSQTFDAATDSLEALRDSLRAAALEETLPANTIEVRRGDSMSEAITGLGSLAGRSKLWFTVKKRGSDTDAEAIIQIEETAGLVYVNGADASARSANGSITVDDESAGDITVALDEVEADDLPVRSNLVYDVQVLVSGTVTTLRSATFAVLVDVTRAVA